VNLHNAGDGVLADRRGPCDCMRRAVATYFGVPYEPAPDNSGDEAA